jgi:hypothetical protein
LKYSKFSMCFFFNLSSVLGMVVEGYIASRD